MRILVIVIVSLLVTAPSFAQTSRGYVEGAGGFAVSPDTTSGNVFGEAAIRVAPHLMVFGDIGQFHNLQPSELQPTVDVTTEALAASSGLTTVGTARVPAWYGLGGLRFGVPLGRVSPYVFAGAGFTRLTPTATFTYSSGTLPGATPAVGDDVTSEIISMGTFTQPSPTTAFTFSLGGGAEIPIARRWAVDVGYRFSHVASDAPLHTEGVTFGFGYRF